MKLQHAIVADDNSAIRQSLRAFLLAVFVKVRIDEAKNGHEVLDLVKAEPPNLVLMDVEMPQVNGLDATRQIKECWPHVRVILIALEPHHHVHALQAGADGFLLKGVSSHELLEMISLIGFDITAALHRVSERPASRHDAG